MISVVIPIYNEESLLPILFTRLADSASSWKEDYEIILVDDGSIDRSFELMLDMVQKDKHFRIIKFSRNFGHQPAISAGIELAKGDAVVIMDGDLQDPPEELHRFLQKWREGYDVVYAIRTKRKENLFKRISYSFFYRILRMISDIDIPLNSGDFCVMDRKVVITLNDKMPENIRFIRGLRAYAGFKQIGVEYERAERMAGKSKYSFSKLFKLALDGLLSFSVLPLRLATFLGFIISSCSFILALFYIVQRVLNFPLFGRSATEAPGFATLIVVIFFLIGIILIILGIIGEYIGRIYIEVKRRPSYIIENVYNSS